MPEPPKSKILEILERLSHDEHLGSVQEELEDCVTKLQKGDLTDVLREKIDLLLTTGGIDIADFKTDTDKLLEEKKKNDVLPEESMRNPLGVNAELSDHTHFDQQSSKIKGPVINAQNITFNLMRSSGEKDRKPIYSPPLKIPVKENQSNSSSIPIQRKSAEQSLCNFRGREEERKFAKEHISSGHHIIWISGDQGIGKTSLAHAILHDLCHEGLLGEDDSYMPIFLDLKGNTRSPLSADEVRTRIITKLQGQTYMPADRTALHKVYHDIVDGKALIIILDNAQDSTQVAELFPRQPKDRWCMIVTSRKRFSGSDSDVLDLSIPCLSSEDADELLNSLIPEFKHHFRKIAALCDFIPLALVWAGRFIRFIQHKKKDFTIDDYLSRLNHSKTTVCQFSDEKPKDSATCVLSVNYGLLDKKEKEIWNDLGIFEDTFDIEILNAIWATSQHGSTETVVNELKELAIITPNTQIDIRYSLHSTAHNFTKDRLDSTRKKELYGIYSRYYLKLLNDLNLEYIRGDKEFTKSRYLFDLEWDNIQRGYKIAEDKADLESEEFMNLCVQYPIAGFDILSLRQTLKDRITWLKKSKKFSYALDMELENGISRGLLANALRHRGKESDIVRAITELGIAINTIKSVLQGTEKSERTLKWLGIHLNSLGNVYLVIGDIELARQAFNEALEIFCDINDQIGQSIVLNNQARALINVGQPLEANEICDKVLEILKDTSDRRRKAGVEINKGIICRHLGKIEESKDSLYRALAILEEQGDRLWWAMADCLLGRTLMDENDESLKCGILRTNAAQEIFQNFGEERWRGIAIGNLGLAQLMQGNFNQARVHLVDALGIATDTGDKRRLAIHNNYLAEVEMKSGNFEQAISFGQRAVKAAKDLRDERREAGAYLSLGECEYKRGEVLVAKINFEQALKLAEKTQDQRKIAKAHFCLGVLFCDQGKKDADVHKVTQAMLNKEKGERSLIKARNICERIGAPLLKQVKDKLGFYDLK